LPAPTVGVRYQPGNSRGNGPQLWRDDCRAGPRLPAWPLLCRVRASGRHAVGLREGFAGIRVRCVRVAAVAPIRSPAVADDETGRRVAHQGDGMAATLGGRLVRGQLALVGGGRVPGRVDVEPSHD